MKYTVEATINRPISLVVELYNAPSNHIKWMPGILSHQITSGNRREPATESTFKFKVNGRDFIIKETIIKNDSTEIVAEFISNGAINTQVTQFSKIDDDSTSYKVNESFELKGFMKVIGILMPGSFKKQTKQFVEAFKGFSENQ